MANRPLCSDDADTTRRLKAIEDALAAVQGGTLAEVIAQLAQDISDLDSRVTALENAG